jgi:hypothetical protein
MVRFGALVLVFGLLIYAIWCVENALPPDPMPDYVPPHLDPRVSSNAAPAVVPAVETSALQSKTSTAIQADK